MVARIFLIVTLQYIACIVMFVEAGEGNERAVLRIQPDGTEI
jgi:hypothetical protein